MSEENVITYKQVEKAVGKDKAVDAWKEIGSLTGAGHVAVDVDGNAAISGVSATHMAQVKKIMSSDDEKKRGNN